MDFFATETIERVNIRFDTIAPQKGQALAVPLIISINLVANLFFSFWRGFGNGAPHSVGVADLARHKAAAVSGIMNRDSCG